MLSLFRWRFGVSGGRPFLQSLIQLGNASSGGVARLHNGRVSYL